MFLTIASIALMGVLVLNMNTSFMEISDKALYQSDYAIDAISICESYVEIAIGKSYDEQTIISATSNPNDLTSKNDLGPDYPEGANKHYDFNDFDDFNNYKDTVNTDRGTFTVSINVRYVDVKDLSKTNVNQTWSKMMTVTVGSTYLDRPVYMEYIYSYF